MKYNIHMKLNNNISYTSFAYGPPNIIIDR